MPDALHGESSRPPGPPAPPFIPGHMGYPSYEECAAMAAILGVYEVLGVPLPTQLAWKIGPWESRLREWVKREVERGNLGKLTGACAERPPLSRSSAPSHGKRN